MTRALFLDRDGVLNIDHGYIGSAERFDVIPGVFDALAQAQSLDFHLIVVTNQSGIARNYFTQADYFAVERHMLDIFAAKGISFTGIYHCPHHPQGARSDLAIACACRKPAPGMILQACADHRLDPARSVLVGDKPSDIQAGRNARVGHCFLIDASAADGVSRFASLAAIIHSPIFQAIADGPG
ncbi:HAD family hydrolase [Sphingobium sp. AN558]|uniref:D-glycero-alpha-D-manno-heptose-1,7-bisphosphate 7-phosphatase n=1 Tax=Sphingobium sp. AN558 TaxID=3133442 RepID=UPI0030C3D094